MGTALGVLFITAAAAIGVGVGLRPTVIDGRRLAEELTSSAAEPGVTAACDREIRLDAAGAEFSCVWTGPGLRQHVRYRMSRDGRYVPVAP